jgi:peptidase C39-like protein/tetratricopeptide repeat protein
MRKNRYVLFILIVFLIGLPFIYNLPPVQEHVGWRIAELFARFKYAISPPEQIVFIPEKNTLPVTPAVPAITTPTKIPATYQPAISPVRTATFKPIPQNIQFNGFRHDYQTWNNCGPATLAMALSYWGWDGTQQTIATFTKPNPRDKNVMPYELNAYVEEETQFAVTSRVGGEIELLKRFIASGIPVILEKGFELPKDGWMGHYVLVTGYDDSKGRFIMQDSYYGPDQVMDYANLESYWRAFNFTYLVVYPLEREDEVATILGRHFDEEYNNRYAVQKASDEIQVFSGRDKFFAWFNRGTSLVQLQDYIGAAEAYDEAFAIYLEIPAKERPWRILWYQTGPYWAYYYSGRYQDVIKLATTTLDAMSEPVLEESYYWRALAREALGDTEGAIKDLRSALKYHPGFEPALTQLQ